jgi:hypothetical protein
MTKVALRKLETIKTDDGRIVEDWVKIGEVEIDKNDPRGDMSEETFNTDKDHVYVGVVHTFTQITGPKEIKFEIDEDTLEEAFDKYVEYADRAVQEFQSELEKYIEQQRNQIVAPTGTQDGGGLIVP